VSCSGQNGDTDDFASALGGMVNMINAGATSFHKIISYHYNGAIMFGCDYGNGQSIAADGFTFDNGCVTAQCGPAGTGWNSHHSWKSTFGRALGSFHC
jgi:hypothetical protein